jgi:hypothetical protein
MTPFTKAQSQAIRKMQERLQQQHMKELSAVRIEYYDRGREDGRATLQRELRRLLCVAEDPTP